MKRLLIASLWTSISFAQAPDTDTVSREKIRQTIHQQLPSIRKCYEAEIQNDPQLKGKVVVEFEVSDEGSVRTIKIKNSTVENISLQECVMDTVAKIRFPSAPQGQVTVIDYPFVFEKGKK